MEHEVGPENDRDIRHLSATVVGLPELREADIDNVYLSRGPRIRLSAEQIRDQALAVSGLLSHRMYGEPVGLANRIQD